MLIYLFVATLYYLPPIEASVLENDSHFNSFKQRDSLVFSDFSFRTLSAHTSEEEMRQELGEPDTVATLNGTLAEARSYRGEGQPGQRRAPVATFYYEPGIRYKLQSGTTYLEAVDFRENSAAQVHHPKITLDSATSMEDIENVFPDSYEVRNQGLSLYRTSLSEDQMKAYEFVTLKDTLSEHFWQVELGFLEGKLANFVAMMLPKAKAQK